MSAPVIETRQLSVRFGAHQALQDISFTVPRNGFLAILGPNGSGKTTLIKTLLGLTTPSDGEALVFGSKPTKTAPDRIGYVPQIKSLDRSFPARALELVVTGLRQRWPARISSKERSQASNALEQVGAKHLIDRPLGELSGGELQRVYLARSLIRRPELVMLDEPATGIDAVGASDLYDKLERYQKAHGATILMITHDWNAAYHHATHALLLDRAQVSFGPPSTALTEECLREAFGHVGHSHLMHLGGGEDA